MSTRMPARTARLVTAVLCLLAGIAVTVADAMAQGWWPWSQPEQRPVPREPVRPPSQLPPPQPGQPPPGSQASPYGPRGPSNICLQLEQRLVLEMQGSNQGREALPKIEMDMRELDRTIRSATIQLDRSDCWDQFLFSKTLRRNPRCIQLNADVENSRRRMADLDRQRRQIMGTGERSSYQDDIVRELARNGCGQQYVQEARKRDAASNPFAMLFGEESDGPRGPTNQFGNLPFATYRTLCVRLCDGYYFPVSFSTLPNHFQRDAQICQSQCAAPAELYYHQNPGGAVEQALSANGQQPYTSLKSAFRYRKEFVQGCSCKQAEYKQSTDRKADLQPPPATGPNVRLGANK
ncbi:MAG: DUF2865 domain-containing protein [Hyphomonadaceae bacterium]|nr:DUF2865 domain-containing protein [Hyphomonadaceae bacterium]